MSISLAANFISKLSFNFQPRLVSLPWLKRSSVRCFSNQADGSELPVRYIPKKHPDVNQAGCSSAPKHGIRTRSSSNNGVRGRKTLDAPHGSRTNHKQSNVSFDDAHGVNDVNKHGKITVETKCFRTLQEVVECMNVPKEVVRGLEICEKDGLGQGCLIDKENSYHDEVLDNEYMESFEEEGEDTQLYYQVGEGKQERSNCCRTKQDAEKIAVELLAKRAFTAVELRKKLIAKNFPVNVAEAVICDFKDRGLINDRLYAEMFSHSRWKSSSWGPRRIKQALMKKGVKEGDVEKAIKLVFEDGKDCDIRSSTRLSNSSLQQLYVQSSKQWQRSQNVPHETRKARVIRWLQYRGFDWAVVSVILKKLESDCPP